MGRAKLSPQEFEQTKDELLRKLDNYSDSILLDPVKAAIVLDVSVHTLDQHRRKGLPPPYIKMSGMRGLVKYELGEIRRYIQSCKTSSTSAATVKWGYQFCDGRHNFLMFQKKIIDVAWGKSGLTLDALMSSANVSVKRQTWDDAFNAEWEEPSLKSDYISDMEKQLLLRDEFEQNKRGDFNALLKDIEEISRSPELVSPLRIASPPFTRISSTIHLSWIRQHLNAMIKEKPPKNIMMMAILQTALYCKSSLWTIEKGIPTLMNESSLIVTPSSLARSSEIAHHVKVARDACRDEFLIPKRKTDTDYIVDPQDLLVWAEHNNVPVDPEIAKAIRSELLGHIRPQNNDSKSRPQDTQKKYDAWQEKALEIKNKNPNMSMRSIAIHISKEIYNYSISADTIRRHIKV